ncbi:E-selectin-like [Oppia nitens]|uniref:E-selectin-like n=1 Tax=Oppia nitens TaxID=1686743 RepID=UPI0023DCCEE9|nr:E-selectin-like [Oppia nitens]
MNSNKTILSADTTIECPNIGNPEHGTASGTCSPGTPSGICSFSCSNGFNLDGQTTVTCNPDGQWTDKPAVCKPKECPPLSPGQGVIMSGACTPGLFDQSCTLSCESDISQTKVVKCQEDGTWSESTDDFECIQTTISPTNSTDSCRSLNFSRGVKPNDICFRGQIGTKCLIQCKRGYQMAGRRNTTTLTCNSNGKWRGRIGICLRQCIAIPAHNGLLTGQCLPTGLAGRHCALTCAHNYLLVGPRYALCTQYGVWEPMVPRCVYDPDDGCK